MHRILQNYVWLYFMKDKLIDHVSDAAEMPKDVALKAPILTLTGRTELTIENYRGIQEYSVLLIRVQTGSGEVRIKGKNLWIEYYTNLEMLIRGRIIAVEFKN